MLSDAYIELVDEVSSQVGEELADQAQPCLETAMEAILLRRFPFSNGNATWADTNGMYDRLAVRIAVALANKTGAEGEKKHEENGTLREYEAGDVPTCLLRAIVPKAGLPR